MGGCSVGERVGPFDGAVVPSDGDANVVRGLFVVHMGREKKAEEGDDTLLAERYPLVQVPVAVAGGVHEHEPDRLNGSQCLDCLAESASGVGDEPARGGEDSLERQIVSPPGGHRVAAGHVLSTIQQMPDD
jgi:hypothetical protein